MRASFCPACRHSRNLEDAKCLACGVPRPPAGWPVDQMIGKVIDDKYRIDKRLSTGGFGTVFLATQMHGRQELGLAVLKFLHQELAHDPNVARRFVTEAQAARELSSAHVVRVFDLGFSDEGIPFQVQEFVEGQGLDEVIKEEGPLPVERAVRIGMQIAEAMDEAHGKGILHRDLKPENLRVQQTMQGDFVKVLDFGIARVDRGTSAATNSFIGTPRYMPPEQITQKGVDPRSDVFALGVILFEMLTKEPPILAESEMEYIHLNLVAEPRDIGSLRPDLPPALASLVMRMMSKEKEARPAGMAIVHAELRDFASATIPPSTHAATLPKHTVAGPTPGEAAAAGPGQTITKLPRRSPRGLAIGIAAGTALLVIGVVALAVTGGSHEPRGGAPMPPGLMPVTVPPIPAPPSSTTMPQPFPTGIATPAPGTAAADAGAPETAAPRTARPGVKRRRPRPRPGPDTTRPRIEKIVD